MLSSHLLKDPTTQGDPARSLANLCFSTTSFCSKVGMFFRPSDFTSRNLSSFYNDRPLKGAENQDAVTANHHEENKKDAPYPINIS